MTEKIIEALAKILDELNQDISIEDVNKNLSTSKDFDKQTLSAAFSLVYDKVLSHKVSTNRKPKQSNTFRMLTNEEKDLLGTDNTGYLMYLHNVGLLDSVEMEMVLEQLMMFPDDSVNKNDINWIVYISLVDFSTEILPGSRLLLDSTDQIN